MAMLTLTVANTESWDILMGGTWPIYSISGTGIPKIQQASSTGVYVVIQHKYLISGFLIL